MTDVAKWPIIVIGLCQVTPTICGVSDCQLPSTLCSVTLCGDSTVIIYLTFYTSFV